MLRGALGKLPWTMHGQPNGSKAGHVTALILPEVIALTLWSASVHILLMAGASGCCLSTLGGICSFFCSFQIPLHPHFIVFVGAVLFLKQGLTSKPCLAWPGL